MKKHVWKVVSLLLASLTLTACSTGDRVERFVVPPAPPPTAAGPVTVAADTRPGDFPSFRRANYTFTYRIACFCYYTGSVKVRVRDYRPVETTYVGSELGEEEAGEPAPLYLQKSVNDIIRLANKSRGPVVFRWPTGQEYPSYMAIDANPKLTDDDTTYTIEELEVEAPAVATPSELDKIGMPGTR